MGGIVARLVSVVTAALKRQLIVCGLWVASGLFAVFAAGYALSALHAALMFRWGSITASLVVAGGLLLFAVGLIVAGYVLSQTRSPSLYQRLQDSPAIARTAKVLIRPKRTMAPAAAGAIAGAVAVGTLAFLRRRRAAVQELTAERLHRDRFD
ncbi:hypothetical protein J2X48_005191 [Bosea sp. BE271]|uniref:hypothetical protein n=1 Tax=Bosea TaxID=85413 RepID=UPI0028668B2D|nr:MULTISPECIES: hypothetical protein [Bosea]MDR6831512.1 hypothetical protein [Bosea robiniae]MDR6898221.1 hypothetical protein [Bosea sp. BE109]MDR7141618.1 hypothetical protein [Bosea sp. BE168]MDR7178238.1 hypothetical protein [Bosea sp. BE271]